MALTFQSNSRRNRGSSTPSKAGGGCMMFFGLPFFLMGMLFFTMPIWSRMQGKPEPPTWLGAIGVMLFSSIFIAIGGAIIWGGIQTMRGYDFSSRRKKGKAFTGTALESPNFPKVNTAGRGPRGGVLVKPEAGMWAKFIGLIIVSAFWNGISWFAMFQVTKELRRDGGFAWIPVIFIGLFCLIGIALVLGVFHALFRILLVGDTPLEISAEPLKPGERGKVSLYQKGSFEITEIIVSLVCREKVTYSQGTRRVTSTEEVSRTEIVKQNNSRANNTGPVVEAEFLVPNNAMHSFKASNNVIEWGFEVKIDIPGKPDVNDFYPVRVMPVGGR